MTNEIHNEQEFSNWLADNIHVLTGYTGWDIHPASIKRERRGWGGAVRVDLFCEATRAESDEPFNVVIENQLKITNNDHLARIMAYAAAFDAKGAVWIAEDYTDIHKRVIRWINANTVIDAYLLKLDRSGAPHLTRVAYPGMPEDDARPPRQTSSSPARAPGRTGWRAMARTWFKRALPKVSARCERFGVWQPHTMGDLKPPVPEMMWIQQPVIHCDSRVSEYISWYIELHADFVRIGLYVPGSPRDMSHYYFDSLIERMAEMEELCGYPLSERRYRGGPKHISWEPFEGVGYECLDEDALELEAEAVAYDMEGFIEATMGAVSDLIPYE